MYAWLRRGEHVRQQAAHTTQVKLMKDVSVVGALHRPAKKKRLQKIERGGGGR